MKHQWEEQPGEPPVDVCVHCGVDRDDAEDDEHGVDHFECDGTLDYEERRQVHPEEYLNDASDEAMDRWARRYDELNGAPENEEDR